MDKTGNHPDGLGITVAIAIAVVSLLIMNHQDKTSQQPPGVAVTTVPNDPIGGAPILPVTVASNPSLREFPEPLTLKCQANMHSRHNQFIQSGIATFNLSSAAFSTIG